MDPDGWRIATLIISSVICIAASVLTGADIRESSQEDTSRYGLGVSVRAVTGILFAVILSSLASMHFFSLFRRIVSSDTAAMLLSLLSSTLFFSLFLMTPFFLGQARSDRLFPLPPAYRYILLLFAPLTQILMLPSRLMVHAIGAEKELTEVTEEDVLELVDTAEEDVIDSSQKEMIGNIIELDDVDCGDIATHRTEIIGVPIDCRIRDVVDTALESGFSRLPVYETSLDNILGVCHVKDLFPLLADEDSRSLRKVIRPVLYVPETYKAYALLRDFRQKKIHLAVVVDEYGGTAGIATMEDILEAIVGDIQDEYDKEESLLEKQPDGSVISDGYAEILDVFSALGLEPPEDADEEYDTIGGLVTDLLGYIPGSGAKDSCSYGGALFTVLEADGKRVTRILSSVQLPSDRPAATE
ncbi:MAG: HlyC/CorC family transporter [Oscillospiraceae bacterium]|nr:HlyC/CorC family transporter [Oscillospiraceae bacterium]